MIEKFILIMKNLINSIAHNLETNGNHLIIEKFKEKTKNRLCLLLILKITR